MKILILGATGQIGQLLAPKLIEEGHAVFALVRDENRGKTLAEQGAELIVADLEGDIDHAFEGMDGVLFTAGSGSATGKDKTLTVDLWAAIKCVRAAEAHGAKRFIMISALNAHNPDLGSEVLKPYLAAKHAADEILKSSKLNYTILRPGRLTNEPGSGHVQTHFSEGYEGSISRANVAECVRLCLALPSTDRRTIELLDGDKAIADALA